MLNNVKNAIRKQKLHFTVKHSLVNIYKLHNLLANNIISGFFTQSKRKKSFLIAFINYNYNFNTAIANISNTSNKSSAQLNNNVSYEKHSSNFIINVEMSKKRSIKNNIKFR